MSFRSKQTIERVTGGYYDDDGMWHEGQAETLEIIASVQPLNQNEKTDKAKAVDFRRFLPCAFSDN